MKVALTSDGGESIQAWASAPKEARCPYCGGVVILRGRRLMNSEEKTYFWRHRDNTHLDCPGRARTTGKRIIA